MLNKALCPYNNPVSRVNSNNQEDGSENSHVDIEFCRTFEEEEPDLL